jgi:hypothetical protein
MGIGYVCVSASVRVEIPEFCVEMRRCGDWWRKTAEKRSERERNARCDDKHYGMKRRKNI